MESEKAIHVAAWSLSGDAVASYEIIRNAKGYIFTGVHSLEELENALGQGEELQRAAILEISDRSQVSHVRQIFRSLIARDPALAILIVHDEKFTPELPPAAVTLALPFSPAGLILALGRAFNQGNGRKNEQCSLEMWGGIECTVNRVGDNYFDQSKRNGHCSRMDDIPLIASLGVSKLRYPVLWETHAEDGTAWSTTGAQLELIRSHGIEPIAGLVHHGSGPKDTSLLERSFVQGLRDHASKTAERFPWVQFYTPVNEPLTTARFSCLYGHWYPHHKEPVSFIKALLIELEATRAAMRAIRKINPEAKLVQTEDIGRTYSTPELAYQAEFDNHRRWLSFDLLCGRVTSSHPLWSHLRHLGIPEEEILTFADDPCPPDILGINYYVTSERFLDHRLERYPARAHGGNGRDAYADVCAVRASTGGISGHYGILKEVWERYRLPLALTEVHLGCTREEQIRWMMEAWRAAGALRAEGADMRAITAWSLLGAFDWDSLLVQCSGYYEAGAFDVRNFSTPRPTGVAHCVRSLAETGDFQHPVLGSPGWWRRDIRYTHPKTEPAQPLIHCPPAQTKPRPRPLLITGARGTLGRAFKRLCEIRGLDHLAVTRAELDIADPDSVRGMLQEFKPWAIVNCAGYVRVDEAEGDRDRCFRENAAGPACLAEFCAERSIHLLTFSSDLVFDGSVTRPYVESHSVNPLNIYGLSKAESERAVMARSPDALIVRTSAFFGPWDQFNFVWQTAARLRRGETIQAIGDYFVSPTYVPDLVHACLDLLIDGEQGIWHVANEGEITWADLARRTASAFGLSDRLIEPLQLAEMNLPARRPRYSVLGTEKAVLLPALENALLRFFAETNFS